MMNDYILVTNGKVIDLAFEVSVVFDNSQNQGSLITTIVNTITTYMNPASREMGQNIYLSEIRRLIQSENGVITITDLKVFNRVGGLYSSSETSQSYSNTETKEIQPVQDTIFALPTQIYQVRFPVKDITVRILNFKNVSIS
jgi:hypothetical protein